MSDLIFNEVIVAISHKSPVRVISCNAHESEIQIHKMGNYEEAKKIAKEFGFVFVKSTKSIPYSPLSDKAAFHATFILKQ